MAVHSFNKISRCRGMFLFLGYYYQGNCPIRRDFFCNPYPKSTALSNVRVLFFRTIFKFCWFCMLTSFVEKPIWYIIKLVYSSLVNTKNTSVKIGYNIIVMAISTIRAAANIIPLESVTVSLTANSYVCGLSRIYPKSQVNKGTRQEQIKGGFSVWFNGVSGFF